MQEAIILQLNIKTQFPFPTELKRNTNITIIIKIKIINHEFGCADMQEENLNFSLKQLLEKALNVTD